MKTDFRINNFDLIRLFAAFQVVFLHIATHLNVSEVSEFAKYLKYFPGVPVFFFVSGFLISKSWQLSTSSTSYFRNRFLRIFPALWVCLLISVCIFLAAGVRPSSYTDFFVWVLAQMSVAQFYNPDFLREFGVGVINGSLWTIPVELQFYIVLPLLAVFAKDNMYRWAVIVCISIAILFLSRYLFADKATLVQKLIAVSLAPYLFYFMMGIMLRYLYEAKPALFAKKFLFYVCVYVVSLMIHDALDVSGVSGNHLNVLQIILLGFLTISAAYSWPDLSEKILRKNDISYGLYIYHMPIVNLLVFYGYMGLSGLFIAIFVSLGMSLLSWRLVERPALRLKKNSLFLNR